MCVFVIVYPAVALPSVVAVYPLTASSSTVYSIAVPFSFAGKLSNVPFQLLLAFNVSVFPSTFVPFASKFTTTDDGRIPSWLLLSLHTFITGTFVVSGNSTVNSV